MAEKFCSIGDAAVGTDKTLINLFNPAATPTSRGRIYDLVIGCAATPADQATKFYLGRTTAVGTEGSGFTPNNIDPAGPAGAYDAGIAHSAEPTYTASKQLMNAGVNQRATFRWVAAPGCEIVMAATQNNGVGLKSSSGTGTASHNATLYHEE
jgi:hypothetical protein